MNKKINKKIKIYTVINFISWFIVLGIIFSYLSIFIHEFFHLIFIIFFGADQCEFYTSTEGGYVRFVWDREKITPEEFSLSLIAGSFFTVLVFLLISFYFYRKKRYSPSMACYLPIYYNFIYWYNRGADYKSFMALNPCFDSTFVINLLYFILVFIIIYLIVFTIYIIIKIIKIKNGDDIKW